MLRSIAKQSRIYDELPLPYSSDKSRRKMSRDTKNAGYVAMAGTFLFICGIWALTDHARNGHSSYAPMTMHMVFCLFAADNETDTHVGEETTLEVLIDFSFLPPYRHSIYPPPPLSLTGAWRLEHNTGSQIGGP